MFLSARAIFSRRNIQGLPTWYEVRVTEKGYLARRGGVDMMVAMNPQTWDSRPPELDPGGYLSEIRPAAAAWKFREESRCSACRSPKSAIQYTSDPRQRQLIKNIVYLGALSVLLGLDPDVIEKLFGEQYKGKERLLDSNVKALHLGRRHAQKSVAAA